MATDPVSLRDTEKGAQLVIHEFFKSHFTGQPHQSLLGDVTFPEADLLYNQAQLPDPAKAKPQIHTVIRLPRKTEHWFASGDLSDWEIELESPASGVAYGYANGRVEEAVHGKLVRRIDGLNIRWRAVGPNFVEEVNNGLAWETVRTFPGASDLKWTRVAGDYVETALIGASWVPQRSVSVSDKIWDGSKILVRADAELSITVRVWAAGDKASADDNLCRTVADNVKELFEGDARFAVAPKGLRHPRVKSGPIPMPGLGVQTRLLVVHAQLNYFSPRWH